MRRMSTPTFLTPLWCPEMRSIGPSLPFWFFVLVSFRTFRGQEIQVWLTTPNQNDLLSRKDNLTFDLDGSGTAEVVVEVDEHDVYQEVDGFGGDLTESAAWLLMKKMDERQRSTFLRKLFDPMEGIGLTLVRLAMGSSEFSIRNYTYDETCCDLGDFSVDKDKDFIIPVLKEILAINRKLLLLASSWSPPAWMKTSNSLIGGHLRRNQYSNLATYFAKYIIAYQYILKTAIYAVSVQERPLHPPCCSPGMNMTPEEQGYLIRTKLGPLFLKYNIATKILLYGQGWEGSSYPTALLNDPEVRGHAAGTAFSCDGNRVEVQSGLHKMHRRHGIWLLECVDNTWIDGGLFSSLFAAAMHREVIDALRNWAKGVAKGSFVLDAKGGPTNGGCLNCVGLATWNGNGTLSLNAAYYSLGHVSKFTRRGAVRIHSTSFKGGVETVAFLNPDGTKVLVAFNNGNLASFFKVQWSADRSFFYNLPSRSAVTLTWASKTPTIRRSPFRRIEAESGIATKNSPTVDWCHDVGGGCGQFVSGGTESPLVFRGLDFGKGNADSVAIRVLNLGYGAVQFLLDSDTGTTIALVEAKHHLGQWTTVFGQLLVPVQGIHDLYIVFRGRRNNVRLNWFVFNLKKAESQTTASLRTFYRIVDEESGLALTSEEGLLFLRPYAFDDSQAFRMASSSDGKCFDVYSKKSNKVSANGWRLLLTRNSYLNILSCSTNESIVIDNYNTRKQFSFVAIEKYEKESTAR